MKTVRTILLGLAIVAAVGLYCHLSQPQAPEPEPVHIQNVFEIQELLTDAGYYAGPIDGKWGPQTDMAYCNWCAAQYFKKEGGL